MSAARKSESKILDRTYVEMNLEGKAGKVTRREAIALVAQEMGVPAENIGLIAIEGQSGTSNAVGRFFVYGSPESKKKVHPPYLEERTLTKEEREKLRQDRKKKAAPPAEAEAKK